MVGIMSKKVSGVDTLTKTLIKQHGLEKAYWMARHSLRDITDERQLDIWRAVSIKLSHLRG